MYFFSFLVTIRGEKNLYIFKFKNLSIFKNGLILLFFDFEMISNIILSIFKVLPVSHQKLFEIAFDDRMLQELYGNA